MQKVKPKRNQKSAKPKEPDCRAVPPCEAQCREDNCLLQSAFGFLAMIAADKDASSVLLQKVIFSPKSTSVIKLGKS